MDEKYKRKSKQEKINMACSDLMEHMCEVVNAPIEVVNSHSEWYMDYSWSVEDQRKFRKYGVELLVRNKIVPKRQAEKEMDYFILNWGWKIDNEV